MPTMQYELDFQLSCCYNKVASTKIGPGNFLLCTTVFFSYNNVMKSCWQEQPEERPTFSELVTVISTTLVGMVDYLDLNSLALSSGDSDTVSVLPTTTAQSDPVAHSNSDLS